MLKQHDSPKFKQNIAWVDLVFNMMMAFAFLFILSFVQIAVTKQDAQKIDPKAEMMIQMTWPDNAIEDMDLWMRMPDGSLVGYNSKNSGLATLERDDRGSYGDEVDSPIGRVYNPINKEVIMLRGLAPGTYTVNILYYSNMKNYPRVALGQVIAESSVPIPPYPVKVQLIRLNPAYLEITTNEVMMTTQHEEHTAFSFTITEKGEVVDIDKFERPFIAGHMRAEGI